MDDGRFDSLVKALAEGRSRRSVLKGLLGLGGAAIVGSTVLEGDSEAARRPTPTPTPVKCPGNQKPVNGVCTCPASAPNKCGPDCCTSTSDAPYPRPSTHSECCDNACCFGTCYGEEKCCPTNARAGGLPPTHRLCDGPTGKICVEGTCCGDSDCNDPCSVCDPQTHTCRPKCSGACCNGVCYDDDEQVCCDNRVVTGDCCRDGDCSSGFTCCSHTCCATGFCCGDRCCATGCCGGTCLTDPGQLCCNGVAYDPKVSVCCDGRVVTGQCCSSTQCEGGLCCANTCYSAKEYGCCNGVAYLLSESGCCDGELYQINKQVCCNGLIVEGQCCADGNCDGGLCCNNECFDAKEFGCCDGESYQLNKQVCCEGTVVTGACCVDNNCEGGLCCAYACSNAKEYGCCNGTLYLLAEQVCCDDVLCDPDETCVDNVCTPTGGCDPICSGDQTCVDETCLCNPGHYLTGETCALCPAGYYAAGYGQLTCYSCDLNTYQDQPGQSACIPCPDGTYTEHVGQTVCIDCDCAAGNMPDICGCPVPCQPGSAPDQSGMCAQCEPGTASADGTECVPCAPGTFTTQSGSSQCFNCSCGASCNPATGSCGTVGVGGECSVDSDCYSNVCGCDSPPGLPQCMCRFATCFATNQDCSAAAGGLGAISCCEGDCTCFNGNTNCVCTVPI